MTKINLKEILKFYDEKSEVNRKHSSAINAFLGEEVMACILTDYFKSKEIEIQIWDEKVTEGCRKGKWLDKWILNVSEKVLYQTEIKNWSAHSLGGIETRFDADEKSIRETAVHRWGKEWSLKKKEFKNEKVNKVFKKMRQNSWNGKVEPLVCYWSCIHPKGKSDPFFKVRSNHSNFKEVNVFSASMYIRSTKKDFIEIVSPLLLKRIAIFKRLILE